jgi:hypothetical protein
MAVVGICDTFGVAALAPKEGQSRDRAHDRQCDRNEAAVVRSKRKRAIDHANALIRLYWLQAVLMRGGFRSSPGRKD